MNHKLTLISLFIIILFIPSMLVYASAPAPANYIAKISDSSTSDNVRYGKSLGANITSGVLEVDFDMIVTDYNGGAGAGIYLYDNGLNCLEFKFRNNTSFQFYIKIVSTGAEYYFGSAELNKWYHYTLEYDFSTGNLTAVIYDDNGEVARYNITVSNSDLLRGDGVDELDFGGFGTVGLGVAEYDNIVVKQGSTILLQDNFDDGDASDWKDMTGYGGLTLVQYSTGSSSSSSSLKPVKVLFIDPGNNYTLDEAVIDSYGVTIGSDGKTVIIDSVNPPLAWVETNTTMYIVLKIDYTQHQEHILFSPEAGTGSGYWAGGDIFYYNNTYWVFVRFRKPDPDRGYKIAVYKGSSLDNLQLVKYFLRSNYGYDSFEHGYILPNGTILYCADVGSTWNVYIGDPGSSKLYESDAKDPWWDNDTFVNFDMIGQSRIKIKVDGVYHYINGYKHGRIYQLGKYYVAFATYIPGQGPGVGETSTLGYSPDLDSWSFAANDTFKSPYGSGTFRYLGVLTVGNTLIFYGEREHSDGSLYLVYYTVTYPSSSQGSTNSNSSSNSSSSSNNSDVDLSMINAVIPLFIMLMVVAYLMQFINKAFRW